MNVINQKFLHFVRHSSILQKNINVLPRVLLGYFNTLILKKKVLRTIEFTVTADCNVNCEMCYASKIKQKDKNYLTPEQYHSIWKQAKKLGAFSIIISGGEPTTRKDIVEVIAALDPRNTIIAFVTNSIRINKAFLHKLKESGVNILHLSLNSVDEDENDRMRDYKGHLKHVMSIITVAKEMGFEVCLSTVVSHNGFERTKKLTEFAKKNNIGVVFSLACPTGNWAGARENLLTSNEWIHIDQYMKNNPYIRSDWTINLSLKTECPGGREKICISPYGDVMGCGMNFISHGNVLEEPLEIIWKRMGEWWPFKKCSKKCLIALDEEYLEEYLLPIAGSTILPVRLDQHPIHPMSLEMIK
ncbi:MAG: radical SAM protein [Desulfobacterales bacterium]|nr:radical SAM protein [Desulfobacterales bacterium]